MEPEKIIPNYAFQRWNDATEVVLNKLLVLTIAPHENHDEIRRLIRKSLKASFYEGINYALNEMM